MGGIYGGAFTPSEAGGIGAFGALAIALIRRKLTWKKYRECLMDSAKTTAMLTFIIIGAFIFMSFLTRSRIPFEAAEFVKGLELPRYAVLAVILIGYVFIGMFFDVTAAIVVTTPIIFPVVMALGFDPIWYCVIMVKMVEMGLITPPFGVNLFALAAASEPPLNTIYRSVLPFFISDLLNVIILILFPPICTFLPSLM